MRHRQWFRSVFLVVFALMLMPVEANAQTNPVVWEIAPAFDGVYRSGAWFPITITVANNGPDINGALEVRFRGGQSSTWRHAIDLPHNANKRIMIPVLGTMHQEGRVELEVSLLDGDTGVRTERVRLNALGTMQTVVGILSDEGNVLPELSNMRGVEHLGTSVIRLTQETLPERPELLQSFDVLFVHSFDAAALTPAQRESLQSWIVRGGQFVVGSDPRLARELESLLPATTDGTTTQTSPNGLTQGTRWRLSPDASNLDVVQLEPRSGGEVVLRGDGDLPLLVRQRHGAGMVLMAAFDLALLREVGDPATFWSQVLSLQGQQSRWTQFREQGLWMLQESIRLPALRLPSTFGLLGFLLVYILVVGPLNYILLSRFDRREWAYLTIPLLVIAFTAGAYAWGTAGRGRTAVLTQLSVVRAGNGSTTGEAMSYLALFSPSRHIYDLRVPSDILVSDLQSPWDARNQLIDVLYAEDSTRVPSLLVDVGGVRPLVFEHQVEAPQLEATWRTVNGTNEVTLRNRSSVELTDVQLVRGDGQSQSVQSLAPGAEETIVFRPIEHIQGGFGQSNSSSVLDRSTVISQLSHIIVPNLFGGPPMPIPGPPMMGVPDDPGLQEAQPSDVWPRPVDELMILGWQSTSQVPVTIDGRTAESQGETLYIWSVRKER